MRRAIRRRRTLNGQAGLSMVELMVAGIIMVVGFMALIGLVITAIANNTRNRLDTSATMLDLMVVEAINSQAGSTGTVSLTDCAGNTWNVSQIPGTGANLVGTQIDYSQAQSSVPTDYYMTWSVCNGGTTVNALYDVRWNVQSLGTYSRLVTVAAKLKGTPGGNKFYALPINLRTVVGK